MQIIKNTLKPVIERWDDPGDYPSGAGGYPLPSHKYVEYIDGQITLKLDAQDILDLIEYCGIETGLDGLSVQSWQVDKLESGTIVISVKDFEMGLPEPPEREYDHEYEVERAEREELK